MPLSVITIPFILNFCFYGMKSSRSKATPLPSSHLSFEHIMQLVLNVHSNIDYTPYLLYVRILPVQLYYYFICQYIIYQFLIKNRIFFILCDGMNGLMCVR